MAVAIEWIELDGLLADDVVEQLLDELDKRRKVVQRYSTGTNDPRYWWNLYRADATSFPRNTTADVFRRINNVLFSLVSLPTTDTGLNFIAYFCDADWEPYSGIGSVGHETSELAFIAEEDTESVLGNPADWQAFVEDMRTVIENLEYFYCKRLSTSAYNQFGAYLPNTEQAISYSGPYVGTFNPANLSGNFDGEWISADDIESGYIVIGPGDVELRAPGAYLKCGSPESDGTLAFPHGATAYWDADVRCHRQTHAYSGADVDVTQHDGWFETIALATVTDPPSANYHSRPPGGVVDDAINYGTVMFTLRAAYLPASPAQAILDPFYNATVPFWEWTPDGTEDDEIPGFYDGDLLDMDGVTVPMAGYEWGDVTADGDTGTGVLSFGISGYHANSDGLSPVDAVGWMFYLNANFTFLPVFRCQINS